MVTLATLFAAIHAALAEQERLQTEGVEALLFDTMAERSLTWSDCFEEA